MAVSETQVEAAKTAIRDEIGSMLCCWIEGERKCQTAICRPCLCETVAREALTAALSEVVGWQPIETCPKADYKSYFLFNELWEDGWSTVQRANCFDGVWIFDSGLSLTDCETKFNPVMWHADTTPLPPPVVPPQLSDDNGADPLGLRGSRGEGES